MIVTSEQFQSIRGNRSGARAESELIKTGIGVV